MSNVAIALLAAAGFGTWVYTKLMRSTGGNTKNAVTGAALSAGLAFILLLIVLWLLPF